jgi:PhzF family phenazine biosynthesis protein
MKLTIYQVDAFTNKVFSGNPAAICPLDSWISKELMQNIAAENNLSETAYFVKKGNSYEIRWFTPTSEIDLCGHATLASAFVIFNFIEKESEQVVFKYKFGELIVNKKGHLLVMDFPSNPSVSIEEPKGLADALGIKPIACMGKNFCMAVFEKEEQVKNLKPDFMALTKINYHGIIVTAPGKEVDFVSRMFAPSIGINEDPVTGSAHTELIPYWSGRLNKSKLLAKQISSRGGELFCELKGERVEMAGEAVLYLTGEIDV